MNDIDLKDKQEKKETKKRESFVPSELSTYYEKKEHKIKDKQQIVKSSIGFPSKEHRLMITKLFKDIGFNTMKSFFMALVELVKEDEGLRNKLKQKSIELKNKR